MSGEGGNKSSVLVSWKEALLMTCMILKIEASCNLCDKTG